MVKKFSFPLSPILRDYLVYQNIEKPKIPWDSFEYDGTIFNKQSFKLLRDTNSFVKFLNYIEEYDNKIDMFTFFKYKDVKKYFFSWLDNCYHENMVCTIYFKHSLINTINTDYSSFHVNVKSCDYYVIDISDPIENVLFKSFVITELLDIDNYNAAQLSSIMVNNTYDGEYDERFKALYYVINQNISDYDTLKYLGIYYKKSFDSWEDCPQMFYFMVLNLCSFNIPLVSYIQRYGYGTDRQNFFEVDEESINFSMVYHCPDKDEYMESFNCRFCNYFHSSILKVMEMMSKKGIKVYV